MEASIFGRKKKTEVFMTNDLELYTTVHQALKATQIPCRVKIVNIGTQNRRTSAFMGRVGKWPELEIQYYIYASREYAERAKCTIDEYRKSLSR